MDSQIFAGNSVWCVGRLAILQIAFTVSKSGNFENQMNFSKTKICIPICLERLKQVLKQGFKLIGSQF
jgi:hypothetical protein